MQAKGDAALLEPAALGHLAEVAPVPLLVTLIIPQYAAGAAHRSDCLAGHVRGRCLHGTCVAELGDRR